MKAAVYTANTGSSGQYAKQTDRMPEEDDMLEMMTADGSRVGKENLAAVLKWINDRK